MIIIEASCGLSRQSIKAPAPHRSFLRSEGAEEAHSFGIVETSKTLGTCQECAAPPERLSWSVCGGLSAEIAQAVCHFLWDSKGLRTLCIRSHHLPHPHALAGEDRGCRYRAPGTPKCQLGDFGTGNQFFNPSPAVTKTKAGRFFLERTSKGNKIASPPVFTAEGRGQREGRALWDSTSRK
ncbi:hypothetical protein JOQ06_012290 [Pogonophryne albipinna]|uniref:Uncharacterized protein n=1 Tax=Pogonophryne albipinna TaxID=1090488 RepID=A0AAD6BHZ3_9TELE|nr:hypothetical protein JOQ06_012290 [Pogonophryne albipinna]